MTPSVRKPHQYGGLQVTICGKRLRTEFSLVCTFPHKHEPTHIHATLATADDNRLFAIIDDLTKEEVETWQLTGE